jgi:hypothetical protein
MSEQKQLLPEGFVACPSCNHDNQIELVDVFTRVDPKVDPTGELPSVYIVSELKCKCCDEVFELERVDVRFAFPSGSQQIMESDFQNEFVVYTTLNPEEAIKKATKWYTSHFDGQLGEPVVSVIGNTIYTNDARDIIIPSEEGEDNE